MSWTDSITKGIFDTFRDSELSYEFYVEYMDTKRNIKGSYRNDFADFYKKKGRNVNYDGIIISDNNALDFFIENRLPLFGAVPAVFCGINNYSPELISSVYNITGIAENADFEANIKLIKSLHPDMEELIVINDNKTTTAIENRAIMNALPGTLTEDITLTFIEDLPFDEIENRVTRLNKNQIIYMLTYTQDSQNHYISYVDGIQKLSKKSAVPIYGSWDFYFNEGITGGYLTSGFKQGSLAAAMMLQILKGRNASDIPVTTKHTNAYMFDYRYLERFGIDKKSLPASSTIINRPPGFIERYKKDFIFLILFLIILTLYLSLSTINQRFQKRRLKKRNEHLNEMVIQRTQEIEAVSQIKNRILSIISHDLKSPLNSLRNSLKMQKTGVLTNPGQIEKYNFSISQQLNQLDLTLNTILEWAGTQMEGFILSRSEFNLYDLVEGIIRMNEEKTSSKQLQIINKTDRELEIIADRNMIAVILRNLLSNAIKFSWKDSVIIIESLRNGNEKGFSIQDNGTGMDQKQIHRLKHENNICSAPGTENEKGTGFGYYICRDLIDFHGGTLNIISTPGKGTRIEVRLPVS